MAAAEAYRVRIEGLKRLPDTEDYYSKILPCALNSNDDKITSVFSIYGLLIFPTTYSVD